VIEFKRSSFLEVPYNKRSGVYSGRGLIPARVDIDAREAIVDTKSRIGDWEADTVIPFIQIK